MCEEETPGSAEGVRRSTALSRAWPPATCQPRGLHPGQYFLSPATSPVSRIHLEYHLSLANLHFECDTIFLPAAGTVNCYRSQLPGPFSHFTRSSPSRLSLQQRHGRPWHPPPDGLPRSFPQTILPFLYSYGQAKSSGYRWHRSSGSEGGRATGPPQLLAARLSPHGPQVRARARAPPPVRAGRRKWPLTRMQLLHKMAAAAGRAVRAL